MGLGHSPMIVMDGLVLCLDAGNPKSYPGSGTAWNDLSGRSNNCTLTNGPTYSSSNGGYFSFDGTNDYVYTPVNIDANPVTLSAWFRASVVTGNRGILLNDNGGWDKGFEISNSAFAIHVGNNLVSTGVTATANRWYYGILVYNTSSMTFYLDGVSVWTGGASVASTGSTLEIGRAFFSGGAGSRFFNGFISNIMVYNRAITAVEVAQNFNALRGRYGI